MSSSGRGKAAEVRARLRQLVESLPEGLQLPSERELAQRWQVARMTLRRAMDELVLDELVVRRHGSGTYTTKPKVARNLRTVSFSETIRRHGMKPSSRVLQFYGFQAKRVVARRLRIPIGDEVVFFARLRLADAVPMGVEQTFMPSALVPGLRPQHLTGSLYELLLDRYGIEVVNGTSKLEPVRPDVKVAAALQISQSQPCLAYYGMSVDRQCRVCEYTTGVYRCDKYAFTTDLRRAAQAGGGVFSGQLML